MASKTKSKKKTDKHEIDQQTLLSSIDEIEKEKGITKDVMFSALEAALASAYKKNSAVNFNVESVVDKKSGEVKFYRVFDVVETVEDPDVQLSVEDAKEHAAKAKVGDKIKNPLECGDFGRIAAQTARQVLVQRMREAERDILFDEYVTREGEVVTVIVQKIIGDKVVMNLDKVEALLPAREQIPREKISVGDRLKVYVVRVRKGLRGPLIIVSRTHPKLVEKLFWMEIPEVFDKVIEIKGIAREPGVRSKVAVKTNDPNVDPIGACVGVRGNRIRTILKELPGEKIDIVPWNEEITTFVKNALSPAQVTLVKLKEDGHTVEVVVPDNQLSLAIGRQGQNARLAARLTQKRVDIYSDAEYQEKAGQAAKAAAAKLFASADSVKEELQRLTGIGPAAAESLFEAGFTVERIAESETGPLAELPGVSVKKAEKMIEEAKALLADIRAQAAQNQQEAAAAAAGGPSSAEGPKPISLEEEVRKRLKRTSSPDKAAHEHETMEKAHVEKAPPMTFEEALKLFSRRLTDADKAGEEKEEEEKE